MTTFNTCSLQTPTCASKGKHIYFVDIYCSSLTLQGDFHSKRWLHSLAPAQGTAAFLHSLLLLHLLILRH